MSLGGLFTWAVILSVIPIFFYIRYGEEHGSFDNLSTWYTVYSAAALALVFGALVVVVVQLVRVIHKRSHPSDSEPTDA
jgi:hypothetical protein